MTDIYLAPVNSRRSVKPTGMVRYLTTVIGFVVWQSSPAAALSVALPLPHTVARPELVASANCVDTMGAGCELELSVSCSGIPPRSLLVRASAPGYPEELHLVPIWVEGSDRLIEAETVAGRIIDADETRIVFLASSELHSGFDVRILDRRTGATEILQSNVPDTTRAFLTSVGVFLYFSVEPGRPPRQFEQRGRVYTELPRRWVHSIAGDWALFPGEASAFEGTFQLRNLTTGRETSVPYARTTWTATWNEIVLPNGDFLWRACHDIECDGLYEYGFRSCMVETIARGTYFDPPPRPYTDGRTLVYTTMGGSLYLAAGRFPYLDHDDMLEMSSEDPRVHDGWIAWKRTSPATALFLRHPDGRERILASGDVEIDQLSGESIVWLTDANRYLNWFARASEAAVEVGSTLGETRIIDGDWHVVLGRSLFRVDRGPVALTDELTLPPEPGVECSEPDAGLDGGIADDAGFLDAGVPIMPEDAAPADADVADAAEDASSKDGGETRMQDHGMPPSICRSTPECGVSTLAVPTRSILASLGTAATTPLRLAVVQLLFCRRSRAANSDRSRMRRGRSCS